MPGGSRRLTSLPLVTRLGVASAVLALLVAAAFAVLIVAVSALRGSTRRATHAKDVSTSTLILEKFVLDLEGGLRGFVITGNERVLDPWRTARREIPGATERLRRLVATDPRERPRVEELALLIEAYVRDYAVPLVAIARRDPAAARASVATAEGRLRLNEIRSRLGRILKVEDAVAARQSRSARRESSRAIKIGIAALGATALFIFLFGVYLARRIARPVRRVAEAATRVAGGDLSARLHEEGPGEVHELTRSFNVMAASLEESKRELEEQNEQLRESERLRSELVSIISHELRTPLASVLGYSSLLLRRDYDEETAGRYLGIIRAQGERIAALADDLVDLRRAERGGLELKPHDVDLGDLLRDQVSVFSGRTEHHGIELHLEAEPLEVRADRGRLEQVVGNLLANAVKYSPDGGTVQVAVKRRGSGVRVEVADPGMGIPHQSQPQVFTKFFRGEARASGIAGAGLGLAIAREIVEAHGGTIGFESTPGRGSTFWFELPAPAPLAAP